MFSIPVIILYYPVTLCAAFIRQPDQPYVHTAGNAGHNPERILDQPFALFPIQLLPYQYYQIVRGKFLLPSAYFLSAFFTPEFPFQEGGYQEGFYQQKVFEEKGEYSQ